MLFRSVSQSRYAIEIVRHGSARRAKLYYLRNLTGKATKIKERRGADGEVIVEPAYVAPVKAEKLEAPAAEVVEEVVAEAPVAEAPVAEAAAEDTPNA